jgi:uncharacterized membrane protein
MMTGWTMGLEGWLWLGAWILALVVMAWLLSREPRHPGSEDAIEILRARLARGEISADEFERTRRLIQS